MPVIAISFSSTKLISIIRLRKLTVKEFDDHCKNLALLINVDVDVDVQNSEVKYHFIPERVLMLESMKLEKYVLDG